MSDGDIIKRGGGEFTFALGGRCLSCLVGGYNTAVFSSFGDIEDCSGLSARPDAAIYYDKHTLLTKLYAPEKTVSFREEYGYMDGETQGNLTLSFG